MRRRIACLACLALLAAPVAARPEPARPEPARPEPARPEPAPADAMRFPRALGAHPGAALEWWYLTAVVRDSDGRRHGIQLTFFRARVGESPQPRVEGDAPVSAWRPGDLYFAHLAISDLRAEFFREDERAERTGVALAGADTAGLDVWIRDWYLRRLPGGHLVAAASGSCGSFFLDLDPGPGPPIAWGPGYISWKDDAHATWSRYQSYPRLPARGTLALPGGDPLPVEGTAWFDHEWSDGRMEAGIEGWDWMGLRLGDGRSLMLYRMRGPGGQTRHLYGGLVGRDGSVRALGRDDVRLEPTRRWTSPSSGARYPVAWRVRVQEGATELSLQVAAALLDQELRTPRSTRVTYWEGVVEGTALEGDATIRVEGYLELTGYAGGGAPGRISSAAPRGR